MNIHEHAFDESLDNNYYYMIDFISAHTSEVSV